MKTVYKVHNNGNLIIKTQSKSEAKKVYDNLKPTYPYGSTLSVCKEVNGESLGFTLSKSWFFLCDAQWFLYKLTAT